MLVTYYSDSCYPEQIKNLSANPEYLLVYIIIIIIFFFFFFVLVKGSQPNNIPQKWNIPRSEFPKLYIEKSDNPK